MNIVSGVSKQRIDGFIISIETEDSKGGNKVYSYTANVKQSVLTERTKISNLRESGGSHGRQKESRCIG